MAFIELHYQLCLMLLTALKLSSAGILRTRLDNGAYSAFAAIRSSPLSTNGAVSFDTVTLNLGRDFTSGTTYKMKKGGTYWFHMSGGIPDNLARGLSLSMAEVTLVSNLTTYPRGTQAIDDIVSFNKCSSDDMSNIITVTSQGSAFGDATGQISFVGFRLDVAVDQLVVFKASTAQVQLYANSPPHPVIFENILVNVGGGFTTTNALFAHTIPFYTGYYTVFKPPVDGIYIVSVHNQFNVNNATGSHVVTAQSVVMNDATGALDFNTQNFALYSNFDATTPNNNGMLAYTYAIPLTKGNSLVPAAHVTPGGLFTIQGFLYEPPSDALKVAWYLCSSDLANYTAVQPNAHPVPFLGQRLNVGLAYEANSKTVVIPHDGVYFAAVQGYELDVGSLNKIELVLNGASSIISMSHTPVTGPNTNLDRIGSYQATLVSLQAGDKLTVRCTGCDNLFFIFFTGYLLYPQ